MSILNYINDTVNNVTNYIVNGVLRSGVLGEIWGDMTIVKREGFALYDGYISANQVAAFKLLNNDKSHLAKEFRTGNALQILKILGSEKAELASKFTSQYQICALAVLGVENAALASKFKDYEQMWSLEMWWKKNAEMGVEKTQINIESNALFWKAVPKSNIKVLGLDNNKLALEVLTPSGKVPLQYVAPQWVGSEEDKVLNEKKIALAAMLKSMNDCIDQKKCEDQCFSDDKMDHGVFSAMQCANDFMSHDEL